MSVMIQRSHGCKFVELDWALERQCCNTSSGRSSALDTDAQIANEIHILRATPKRAFHEQLTCMLKSKNVDLGALQARQA